MDSHPLTPEDPGAFDVIVGPLSAAEVEALDAKYRPFPSTPAQKVMDKLLVFPLGMRKVDAIVALRAIDAIV